MNFNGSTAANTSNTVAVESVVNSSTAIVTTNRTTVVTSKPPETTTRLPVTTQALRNPTTGMNISFPSGGKYNNKTSISTTRVILTTTPSSTSTPTTPAAAAAVAAAAAAAGVAGSGINSGGVLTTTGLLQSGAAAAATAAAAAGTTVSPVTSDPGYGLRHPWWPAVSVAISMTIFLCISFLRHHRKFQMKRRALIEYMEYELLRNASFSAGSLSSPSRRPPSNPHGDISPRGVPTHIPSHSNSSQANATHLPHFQHHHPTNHMSAAASSSTASASTLSNLATAAASATTQADPAAHHHHHHHHHHYQPHQQQHHQHQQHHQQQQAPDSVYNVSNSLTERRRYNNVRHNDPSQQVALNGYPSKFIQRFLQPNVNPCGLESSSNFTESACCEQSRDFCDHPLDKKESISTRKGSKKYKYTRSRNDDKSGVYRKYRILEEDFDLSVPSDYGSQTTSGIIELKPQGYGPAPQHPYHPQGGQQTYHQVHPHSKSHHANHLPPPAPTPAPQPLAPHQQQLHLEQQQKHKALHQQRDLQRGNRNYNTNIMQLLDVSELQNQSSRL